MGSQVPLFSTLLQRCVASTTRTGGRNRRQSVELIIECSAPFGVYLDEVDWASARVQANDLLERIARDHPRLAIAIPLHARCAGVGGIFYEGDFPRTVERRHAQVDIPWPGGREHVEHSSGSRLMPLQPRS